MIGPNGAGKTTIFDLISGFVPLDSGPGACSMAATSASCRRTARAAAGLGRSFQDARLFPDMTVAETLAVSLERWVQQPQRARRRGALAGGVRRRGTHRAARATN